MRIWTALAGWAALMAVATALYALGLSFEANQKGSEVGLFRAAIGFGVVATIIFAGDLFLLGRAELLRRRSLRVPPLEFGTLDYVPEYVTAAQDYAAAQNRITAATEAAAAVFVTKGPALNQEPDHARRQALGGELADASRQVSACIAADVVVMRDRATVMRQCLLGLLRTSSVQSDFDVQALRNLREQTAGLRRTTRGLRLSTKALRESTKELRKKNLTLTLNTATHLLIEHLDNYGKTVGKVERDLRRAEFEIGRKLLWLSVRRRRV